MRKLIATLSAAVLLTAVQTQFTGCRQLDQDELSVIDVSTGAITISGSGGSASIDVQSNAYWSVSIVDETGSTVRWVSADVTSGMGDMTLTLTADRNTTAKERKADILITTDGEDDSRTITLTQESGVSETEGYGFPMGEMFLINDDAELSNGFIDGNSCYLDGGLIITRTGDGDSALEFSCPCHQSATYQRGIQAYNWEQGDAWLFEIPFKTQVSGDLRFGFGSRRDNITGSNPWKFEWSTDGSEWKESGSAPVQGGSNAVWKFIDFTLDKAVPAGGKLYIRMTPSSVEIGKLGTEKKPSALFQHGITLTQAQAPLTDVPPADDKLVVFSTGFDELSGVDNASDITLSMGYFNSCYGGTYAVPDGLKDIVSVSKCLTRPGYLQIGNATGDAQGTYSVAMSGLQRMGIQRTDLKVTFKAAGYQDFGDPSTGDFTVLTDSSSGAAAENGGKTAELEVNSFKEFSMKITGATPATVLTFTNLSPETRAFIDDITIEVDGNTEYTPGTSN